MAKDKEEVPDPIEGTEEEQGTELTTSEMEKLRSGKTSPEWRPRGDTSDPEDSEDSAEEEEQEEETEEEEEDPDEKDEAEEEDEEKDEQAAKGKKDDDADDEKGKGKKAAKPLTVEERLDAMEEKNLELASANKRLEAKLELSRAHSARLAGKLGSRKEKDDDDEVNADPEDDSRVGRLARRIAERDEEKLTTEISQAIDKERLAMISDPDFKLVTKEEFNQVAANWKDDFDMAATARDAKEASLIARSVFRGALEDAMALARKRLKSEASKSSEKDRTKIRSTKRKVTGSVGKGTSARTATAVRERSKADSPDAIAARNRAAGRPGWN